MSLWVWLAKLLRRFGICSFLLKFSLTRFITFGWKLSRFSFKLHFVLVVCLNSQSWCFTKSNFSLLILLSLYLNRMSQRARHLWCMRLWYCVLSGFSNCIKFICFEFLLPILLWCGIQNWLLNFMKLLFAIILERHFQKFNILFNW